MNDELQQLLTIALALATITSGLTSAFKTFLPENSKFRALLPLVIGVLLGIAWSYTFNAGNLPIYGFAGLLSGLSAGGFYNLVKTDNTTRTTGAISVSEVSKSEISDQPVQEEGDKTNGVL